ncbi:MAG: LamG-like jellyroll fold domain-containing protein [Planctomycetota bacterium]
MDDRTRQLIFQTIDQTISTEDFVRLQEMMEQDADVREHYLDAVSLCESLGEIAGEPAGPTGEQVNSPKLDPASTSDASQQRPRARWTLVTRLAVAASVMFLVGIAFWLGRQSPQARPVPSRSGYSVADEESEFRIAGHATLRRAIDVQWKRDSIQRMEGEVLPDGRLAFSQGLVEIDFFCGATLIVEGPADLQIRSDWSVGVSQGRLRASVPPAARGFVVNAAGSEIVDLGTEFALDVSPDNARIEVIDGEVELRGGQFDGKHLLTGQSQSLKGSSSGPDLFDALSTATDLERRRESAQSQLWADWQEHSKALETDRRLIAYYRLSPTPADRTILNRANNGQDGDGLIVGPVVSTLGRFGAPSSGLDFDRAGARIRTRIEGEFSAYTFSCWAKIDGLDHRYNALFMGDGYENGEPHWQIRDDGRLMFSVMVDESQDIRHFNARDQRVVKDAGLHRVYLTPPFWDVSKSGRWFHLAAVYDPIGRQVTQYVNGESVAKEEILDRFFIDRLRIGPAEIGNWGQPFRDSPWFAVRNLDGVIDEVAIFHAALGSDEIHHLYEQGKPLGY